MFTAKYHVWPLQGVPPQNIQYSKRPTKINRNPKEKEVENVTIHIQEDLEQKS